MGTWGGGSFDNDTALDYLADIEHPHQLKETLDLRGLNQIEVSHAEQIIVAAEMVAAMIGRPAKGAPAHVITLAERFGEPPAKLLEAAQQGVMAALTRSELPRLWANADSSREFNMSVSRLVDRLMPGTPMPEGLPGEQATHSCVFCGEGVPRSRLFSITLRQETGGHPESYGTFHCHIACFNGALPAGQLVQEWKREDTREPALAARG